MLTAPPEPDHSEIVVRYVPAAAGAEIGGDWYDAFLQPDGATVLAIGDVVGHDSRAAASMGQLRGLLRGISYSRCASPAEVLQELDRAMEGLALETMATAVVARLEQTDDERRRGVSRVRWSNAGHPPPMVITVDGRATTLAEHEGKALLLVNVASKCGLTPQYTGLEQLHETYAERGFSVLGFPCNQFKGQEPGTPQEIQEFCSTTYGVTFPLYEKLDVNGPGRHPLYALLTAVPDAGGEAGDVQWNFEKFLVSPEGSVVGRFRPDTEPDDPALVSAIEEQLPR
jgi:glutathione peroxidase